eukprot:Platyproteum_vivax@DN11273_c0_g1_i1.p1
MARALRQSITDAAWSLRVLWDMMTYEQCTSACETCVSVFKTDSPYEDTETGGNDLDEIIAGYRMNSHSAEKPSENVSEDAEKLIAEIKSSFKPTDTANLDVIFPLLDPHLPILQMSDIQLLLDERELREGDFTVEEFCDVIPELVTSKNSQFQNSSLTKEQLRHLAKIQGRIGRRLREKYGPEFEEVPCFKELLDVDDFCSIMPNTPKPQVEVMFYMALGPSRRKMSWCYFRDYLSCPHLFNQIAKEVALLKKGESTMQKTAQKRWTELRKKEEKRPRKKSRGQLSHSKDILG